MTPLPEVFLRRPIAHRALHGAGAPENSRAAISRAVAGRYGIEIDLQLSADGRAMVFHDYGLSRLTSGSGPLRQHSSAELSGIRLIGGDEGIPTLTEILDQVAGRVPLLIEIKDQDGALGPLVGPLEEAAALDLSGYDGPVAVMSFNPHSMDRMKTLSPEVPRGLITCAFDAGDWATVPAARRDELRDIPDFDRVGASFISHDADDLGRARVAALKDAGDVVLCWTIRSAQAEAEARKIAHNITFEGYAA